jgi:iron(III) transport system ATP-binding protein
VINAVDISKLFPGSKGGVRGVDLDIKSGEFFTLLGPSGCGKTTTMRLIAGLVRPDTGDIAIGERPMFSATSGLFVPANKRGLGMVFQSYAIWPHLTVAQNVAYPLRVRRMKKAEINRKVTAALEMVDLGDMANRPSPLLSGGQQQRVALARALVAEPSVLLLDEPLSNLDAALRQRMRGWLKDLQTELGVTTLYVTHDQQEALAMSDRIAIMQ